MKYINKFVVSPTVRNLLGNSKYRKSYLNLFYPIFGSRLNRNNKYRKFARDVHISKKIFDNIITYYICTEKNIFLDELLNLESINERKLFYENEIYHLVGAYKTIINKFKINNMITFQGYLIYDAILIDISNQLNINNLTIERTMRSDKLIWDRLYGNTVSGIQAKKSFLKNVNRINEFDCNNSVNTYLSRLELLKRNEHYSPINKFSWNTKKKKKVLFLGQVYTDASLLFNIGNFNNPIDIIIQVLESCLENNYSLILKLHPKEYNGNNPVNNKPYDKITYKKICSRIKNLSTILNDDIIIDHENKYNTYELINQSDLVVTINSQAGLEAAIMDKPILHSSTAFYGGIEIGSEYSNLNELKVKLKNDVLNNNSFKAKQFFSFLYDEYCIPNHPKSLVKFAVNDR